MAELIAYLKANPNKLSATSVGTASIGRFCGMFIQKQTGTSFQFVPYRGGAPALQDVVAGNVDLNCDLAANSLQQVRNGNVKVFAVMAKQRWTAAPDVPTSDEAGLPGFEVSQWNGLLGPAKMPRAIVERIHGETVQVLRQPEVISHMAQDGSEPAGGNGAELQAYMKGELDKWGEVIRRTGAKID